MQEKPISIELPTNIECTIETTDAAIKNQTASSSYKPAKLKNGISVMVPPFIQPGEKIIIDSRNSNIYKKFLSDKIIDIKNLCDRQFGIGGDGVIFILEPDGINYAKMVIYNSDGSEAQMCGNGIRCLVEYIHRSNKETINSSEYRIETKAGLKIAQYNDGEITVKMGKPILDTNQIPTTIDTKQNDLPSYFFQESNFVSVISCNISCKRFSSICLNISSHLSSC